MLIALGIAQYDPSIHQLQHLHLLLRLSQSLLRYRESRGDPKDLINIRPRNCYCRRISYTLLTPLHHLQVKQGG